MACFLVPLTEALVVTAVKNVPGIKHGTSEHIKSVREKLGWLQKLEFGGSFLLAIEHIYHGEVTFMPPFLTAVKDGNVPEMLHEMATAGVSMAVLVTAVWGIAWGVSALVRRMAKTSGNTRSMAV